MAAPENRERKTVRAGPEGQTFHGYRTRVNARLAKPLSKWRQPPVLFVLYVLFVLPRRLVGTPQTCLWVQG